MELLLQDFASTYWWLILLIGLIVGIVGKFMADGIQKLWGLVSSSQRKRNLEREREEEDEIEHLVNYPSEIIDYQFLATQSDLHSTRNYILAFMILFLSFPREETPQLVQYIFMLIAAGPYYVAMREVFRRNRYTRISGEARRRLREKETTKATGNVAEESVPEVVVEESSNATK